jgi:hypothetical protein
MKNKKLQIKRKSPYSGIYVIDDCYCHPEKKEIYGNSYTIFDKKLN